MHRLSTTMWAYLFVCVSVAQPADRPNILFIMTDDQAEWSLGCYGNRESKSPTIDALANDGARFTNAFVVTPVCSPSRATTLTGLYPTQFGIPDWITPAQADLGLGLNPELPTWPKVLKDSGYRTGLIGKWHLGRKPEFHPTKNGFDLYAGHLDGGWDPRDPTWEIQGRPTKINGFSVDRTADEAIRFLQDNRSHPFALCVHFREPHTPYEPMPELDVGLFQSLDPSIPKFPNLKTQQVTNWTRQYYACVHAIDRNVGRILKQLDELRIARQTMVIFTSDHGYNIGHHGIHTKGNGYWCTTDRRGVRPNMWDTSLRVPLIIRWPGIIRPGVVIDQYVTNQDTFPTLLAVAGQRPSGHWRGAGRDFGPILRRESSTGRDTVYGQYDISNTATQSMRMIRTQDWKLVRHYGVREQDELFDLRQDPNELINRYTEDSLRPIRNQLQARLDEWMKSISDPALTRSSSGVEPR